MDILSIDYSGYITIDKNDVVLFKYHPETGEQIGVNPHTLTTDEILELTQKGELYVDLMNSFSRALDGEENVTINFEETV